MKPAIRIALLYAVLSGLYIVGSDWAAYELSLHDPQILTEWQSFKGIMFVMVSALIIFLLVYYFERGRAKAQAQTEIALDSFQQLFDRNPLPAWVYDTATLRCVAANDAVTSEYGYSREEFLRLTIPSLHPPEDIEKILAFISRVRGRPRMSQWRHVRKDGTIMDVEITSHPIQFAGHDARLIVAQNINARKIAERALAEALQAKAEAQKVKARFLSSISHEMRTPLHTISGYFDLLVDEQAAAQRQEYGQIVQQSASELLALIERMIHAADLQTHPPAGEPRPIEVAPFFRGLVDEFIPHARRCGIRVSLSLSAPLPIVAVVDGPRLEETLKILLENAVKFSPDGTVRVEVSMSASSDRSNREMAIAVCDEGVGIPVERQAEIFEMFTQADERMSRKYGGAGLGLFVARQLCELMGATLCLSSTEGEGSCFTVLLTGRMENAEKFVATQHAEVARGGV